MAKYSFSASFNDNQNLEVKSLHVVGAEIGSNDIVMAEDIARDMITKAIEKDLGHSDFNVMAFQIEHS